MNAPGNLPPIREIIVIDAGIDKVWRTMTSAQTVPRWLGCLGYEARVGAVFFMQQDRAKAEAGDLTGATHCEILALEAPKHFRFSWFVPNFPTTFITIRLEVLSPARTQVLFEHEGWDQFPPDMIRPIHDALSNGWKSFVLPGLKREVEAS
jgi:uncharacterized protein YndB with AHSA1/START domain